MSREDATDAGPAAAAAATAAATAADGFEAGEGATASADDGGGAGAGEARIIRKGFGGRAEVGKVVAEDFRSDLIDALRHGGHALEIDGVTVRLAREFGFCYGVDRAIDYAYETRREFPDRRIFLTTEIIHNPRVNERLIAMGIGFLSGPYRGEVGLEDLRPDDVVVLPAFGVAVEELEALKARRCIIVDTTCGSVINVWKKVARYAREGFTSIIHGKHYHEETIATASQAVAHGGHYLVVLDRAEADLVCDYVRGGGAPATAEERAARREAFLARFGRATSAGFDPERDLARVGVANQTTMLASESLEISRLVGEAMRDRWGAEEAARRFAAFDTICPATQERQDAMYALLEAPEGPPDLVLVVGGFNSSNTGQLLEIAGRYARAYHVREAADLTSAEELTHKPYMREPVRATGWLEGMLGRRPLTLAFTGGASTPNRVIGEAIVRTLGLLGVAEDRIADAVAAVAPREEGGDGASAPA